MALKNGLSRVLGKEEFCDLYSQPGIVQVAVWRSLWPSWYVAHIGATRCAYRILMMAASFKRQRLILVDNTKLGHREIDYVNGSGSESFPIMVLC